jgi:hypothetical protein
VYIWPGLSVLTRIRRGPSSHAILRAIWSTADLDELYETHAWSYKFIIKHRYTSVSAQQ